MYRKAMSSRTPSMRVGRSTTVGPSALRSRKPIAYMVEVLPVRTSDLESMRVSKMQTWLLAEHPALACPSRSALMESAGMELRYTLTARERSR
jgi:hypothetical protein